MFPCLGLGYFAAECPGGQLLSTGSVCSAPLKVHLGTRAQYAWMEHSQQGLGKPRKNSRRQEVGMNNPSPIELVSFIDHKGQHHASGKGSPKGLTM